MSKKLVARNAAWNWAGMAAHMLVGFLILPFLIRSLGQSRYGLWLLIGSMTSYFGVLDFGVSGSVGRNVAFFRAKNDLDSVNGLVSTAVAYLLGVALLALAATFGAMLIFFHAVTDVPPGQTDEVRLAIFLVGLNLALPLPLNAFDGVLWAYQRFDLQNGVDIPAVLLRAGLTYYFIGAGYGLAALAVITLTTSLVASGCKALLAFRVERGLRVSLWRVDKERAKVLFDYGVWYFLLSLTRSLAPQVSVLMIGTRLGTAQVTPYSVATRLTGYANSFLIAGTQVMTPLATGLHARDQRAEQRALFLQGGKFCLVLVLFFLSLFVFLGRPLIRLWTGPELEAAYPLLLILALGELLPMSQWVTYGMILGKGRHKVMAWAGVVEIGCGVAGLAIVLAGGFGLMGVCVVLAVLAGLSRGAFQWLYACRLVEVSPLVYLYRTALPAVAVAAGPALVLGLAAFWHAPATWPELFAYGIAFSACYFGVAAVALIGFEGLRQLRAKSVRA